MRAPLSPAYLSLLWHVLPRCIACLALLTPLLSPAQPHLGAGAASPDSATAPLIHQSLTPQPPLAVLSASPLAWREGNEAVADFPRGHADIVAWEARQRAQRALSSAPHGTHRTDNPKNGGTR